MAGLDATALVGSGAGVGALAKKNTAPAIPIVLDASARAMMSLALG